jgi:hypothetical protein
MLEETRLRRYAGFAQKSPAECTSLGPVMRPILVWTLGGRLLADDGQA